jgi:prepilin-type N-terminal cleavage/methylation domain-containing protein
MLNNRLLRRTARILNRGGFTLVELLVVIGIIAILAGVALGPITNGIKQAQHNAAMQTGRQIGQMCFSYATDNTQNGGAYPSDSSGMLICQDLINSNYATDPSVFGIPQQAGFTKATSAGTSTTLVANSVSWSFTCINLNSSSGSGVTSSASDLTPLIYFNNGFSTAIATPFPAGGSQKNVAYSSAAPFGSDGAAIFYKGNNAVYVKAGSSGAPAGQVPFLSANDIDTTVYKIAP